MSTALQTSETAERKTCTSKEHISLEFQPHVRISVRSEMAASRRGEITYGNVRGTYCKKKKEKTLSCSSSLSSQNKYLSTDGKQLLSAQHGQNKTSTSTKVHQSNKRALTELKLLKKEKICAQWWIFLYILPVGVPGTSPCRLLGLNRGNTLSWVLNSCDFLLSTER